MSDKVDNIRNNWADLIEPIPDDTPKRKKVPKRTNPKEEPPPKGLFG